MSTDPTTLEQKVYTAITSAPQGLTNREVQIAVLGAQAHSGYSPGIDRIIQKLKRQGLIVLVKAKPTPRWVHKENMPCTHCYGTGREP